MLADTKKQILSLVNLRVMAVMLPALVLSVLAGWVMYLLGYPMMVLVEIRLIVETLMHLVLGAWSALKAIVYGIVVFGLFLALLLPVLIAQRLMQKKRNLPSAASNPTTPLYSPSSGVSGNRRGLYLHATISTTVSGSHLLQKLDN